MKSEWQAARQVITAIEAAGYEAVIVGGAVRDYYLNKASSDVDVATSALPTEVKAIFKQTVDVGIEHGTVLVLDAGEPIEVTTYRTESTYSDHRRPDEVVFVRSLAEDMQRRDFTMNAMALNQNDEFIDLYGGRKDLDAGIICAVGHADERFREDALRMLRAVRFCSQLGFTIEEQTLAAMQTHAATIAQIAVERVQVELSKLWCGDYVARGMEALVDSHLAEHLPGRFDPQQWQLVQTDKRLVGWAYFCYVSSDASLMQQYRCSNKDKLFVTQTLQAAEALERGWCDWDYFLFELEVLHAAYLMRTWQGQQPAFPLATIAERKSSLPIQQKSELAISGQHLLQWAGDKRGPWMKTALTAALHGVVTGTLDNNVERLKDWFLHEFNDER
ncbi:MAG: CCA tRNA nucleotidyltransferase [Solibacillus sp.]